MKLNLFRRSFFISCGAIFIALSLSGAFPHPEQPNGVESSTFYAINAAAANGWIFGKQMVFTYGPLGYLIKPMDVGNNLVTAITASILLRILFAAVLVRYALQKNGTVRILLFVPAYLLAVAAGLYPEDLFLAVILLLLSTGLEEGGVAALFTILGVILAGISLFIKFTIGTAALGSVGLLVICILFESKWRHWRFASLLCGFYLGTLVVTAFGLMKSSHAIRLWLRGSVEIASGHSIAESLTVSALYLYIGIAGMVVFVTGLIVLARRRQRLALFYVISLACLFIGFKHGYVRQSETAQIFFPFLMTLLSMGFLHAGSIPEFKFQSIVFSGVLLLEAASFCSTGTIQHMQLFPGSLDVMLLLNFKAARQEMGRQQQQWMQPIFTAAPWAEEIRHSGRTVDVVPWEIDIITANGFDWKPNPVVHPYVAYTPYLDHRSALHFAQDDPPGFLIWHPGFLDQRCLMWDVPETFRTILEWYSPQVTTPERDLLIFHRNASSHGRRFKEISTVPVDLTQWIDVPADDAMLFAKLEMRLPPMERITATLFRIRAIFLAIEYDDNTTVNFRVMPENTQQGLLVSPMPEGTMDLLHLFSGDLHRKARRMHFYGAGLWNFDLTTKITWCEWM